MDNTKSLFDWGLVINTVACLVLSTILFIFVWNNVLFEHWGRNLWRADVLVILGLVGVPLGLNVRQLIRGVMRSK